jgi:acyl dehydratase
MTAKVRYADVSEGEELKPWTYDVQRLSLVMYAGASGDFNPIHWNEPFAKAVGLPDVISHGMFTMARIGQFVTDWIGDPGAVKRFKTRFTLPVVVPNDTGSKVTVSGKVARKLDSNRVLLEVSAAVGDANVGAAEAEVELA